MPRLAPLTLLVDALAVWRLALLIAVDVFPPSMWLREKILSRWPDDDTVFMLDEVTQVEGEWVSTRWNRPVFMDPESTDDPGFLATFPYRWSKLLTCIHCLSVWLAAGVVALRWFVPAWEPVAIVLALAAASNLLNLVRTGR